jgi:hypothetical protein
MNEATNNNEDFGAALALLGLMPFIIVFLVLFVCAITAAVIADYRNRNASASFLPRSSSSARSVSRSRCSRRAARWTGCPVQRSGLKCGRWPKDGNGSYARGAAPLVPNLVTFLNWRRATETSPAAAWSSSAFGSNPQSTRPSLRRRQRAPGYL